MSVYCRSQYQYGSAILTYRYTVLNAFIEANSALSAYKEDNKSLMAYQQQLANTKHLLSMANAQHKSGLADYTTYLSTKLNYLQQAYNYTKQQLLIYEDIIQFYKALGISI